MDRAADFLTKDRVDETMLLDSAQSCKGRRAYDCAEVIAAAIEVFDLGWGARNSPPESALEAR